MKEIESDTTVLYVTIDSAVKRDEWVKAFSQLISTSWSLRFCDVRSVVVCIVVNDTENVIMWKMNLLINRNTAIYIVAIFYALKACFHLQIIGCVFKLI